MADPIFGVIDIGSNTVHLLVARSDGRTIVPLVDASASLYLGREVIEQRQHQPGEVAGDPAQAPGVPGHGHRSGRGPVAPDRHAGHPRRPQPGRGLRRHHPGHRPADPGLSPEHEAALAFVGAEAVAPAPTGTSSWTSAGAVCRSASGRARPDGQCIAAARRGAADRRVPADDPPTAAQEAALAAHLAETVPPALPQPGQPVAGAIAIGGMAAAHPATGRGIAGRALPGSNGWTRDWPPYAARRRQRSPRRT